MDFSAAGRCKHNNYYATCMKDQGTLGKCSKDDFITVKFCDCSIRLS